mgnify:CR=1 FL=1
MSSKEREKYRLKITPRFDKCFLKLPKQVRSRIARKIDELKMNPHAYKKLHGKFEGLFSMRIGDYRVIYIINEKEREVILLSATHRRKAYEI